MKLLPIILFLCSSTCYSWECAERDPPVYIEEFWNQRPRVIVAQVVSGKYDLKARDEYEYQLLVKHWLKGNLRRNLNIQSRDSLQLSISEKYIFPIKNSTVDFCELILPFSYSWLERFDIPVERARVEKLWSFQVTNPNDTQCSQC
ncbi:hypothetical protein [Microbulbifer sp. TRSA005]|uniref:hypothetical protein n=1 Tax=Microbulbifer sp. TRSA005 TaxID=3243383 RepID=UPI00403A193B